MDDRSHNHQTEKQELSRRQITTRKIITIIVAITFTIIITITFTVIITITFTIIITITTINITIIITIIITITFTITIITIPSSELLQDLENCENDPVAIAECFVSKSEEFHIYTQYCTNYPRSVAVLTECMRNKILAKFFRERQETLKHSLPLGSYLLKPVQRILKYHLLLHEIENHLDKDTEGYDVVLDAIDTMQRVAWHINDMKRRHEHAVRLQEIQSLLTNWKGPDLTSYGELVLEGTFRIQRAKNERTLFLLDKLLLITKKRDDTFTYKAHILCGNLMLVEVIPKEPLSFSVFHYKNPKLQHTVQAKSQQDKRLWVLHLKRLILENHAAKIPAKAKQAILEMDAIHHPGFWYSPEGQMKTPCGSKEGSAPYRQRRKS
ncbi:hypothetical protein STEG23_032952, partial [Scotinomys teguina]